MVNVKKQGQVHLPYLRLSLLSDRPA